MSQNWSEKYKPKSFAELLHHSSLIELFKKTKQPINMILYGPHGTGKTCISQLYLQYINYPYLYLNYYEDNWENIINQIITYQESISLFSEHTNKKIIIIDNINFITIKQQHDLYKRLSLSYFILISNYTHHILSILRSKFIEIFIEPIPSDIMIDKITQICQKENHNIPQYTIIPISMRQALAIAQCSYANKIKKEELSSDLYIENITDFNETCNKLKKYNNPELLYFNKYKKNKELIIMLELIEQGHESSVYLLTASLLIYKNKYYDKLYKY